MTSEVKKAKKTGTVLIVAILILLIAVAILTYFIFSDNSNEDNGVFVNNTIQRLYI